MTPDAGLRTPDVPLIELRGVTKTYGGGATAFQALVGVNLRVQDGEFVAIMGPSGSGKSTVMNILGCLDTPTTGTYGFRGIHVESLSRNQRALLRRHCLGFVFQGFNLLARTTAVENVELPLLYRGVPARERRVAALEALALVGLAGWETHTPAELSGGQQQRVAIARALVTRPLVLLADEPTGNLDTQRTREIMELLASLNRERGLTILMVTHEPQAAGYARRVVHFLDGRVENDVPGDDGRADTAHDDPSSVRAPGPRIEREEVRIESPDDVAGCVPTGGRGSAAASPCERRVS